METARANDVSLLSEAEKVGDKFKKAFTLFSKCHQLYDGTFSFNEEQVTELG